MFDPACKKSMLLFLASGGQRPPYKLLIIMQKTAFCIWRVALDKVEGVVKAKITCAVRERRDLRQRG